VNTRPRIHRSVGPSVHRSRVLVVVLVVVVVSVGRSRSRVAQLSFQSKPPSVPRARRPRRPTASSPREHHRRRRAPRIVVAILVVELVDVVVCGRATVTRARRSGRAVARSEPLVSYPS
jgi:hypothetical protein